MPSSCTVSHITIAPPPFSWLFFKAVRAGLAVTTSLSDVRSEQRGKTANWPRPGGLRLKMGRRLRDVGEASSLCSVGKKQSETLRLPRLAGGPF